MLPRILRVSLLFACISLCSDAPAATYNLASHAAASGGGVGLGTSYRLGFSVGQSVIRPAGGPSMPLYAELAGFWRWGRLPVLDAPIPDVETPIAQFALHAVAPNPFARSTAIRFDIPSASGRVPVDLRLYDISGRMVRVLEHGLRGPGALSILWDGRGEDGTPLGAGVYFCRFEAGSFVAVRRLVLTR